MTRYILEDDIDSIRLTDNQKKVLVMAKAAPTARVAYEDVSNDANLVAARDELRKMNYIDVAGNSIEINDAGISIMRDEALTDESDELIPSIKEKYLKDVGHDEKNGDADAGAELAGGPIGGEPIDNMPPPQPKTESFSLMKKIINEMKTADVDLVIGKSYKYPLYIANNKTPVTVKLVGLDTVGDMATFTYRGKTHRVKRLVFKVRVARYS